MLSRNNITVFIKFRVAFRTDRAAPKRLIHAARHTNNGLLSVANRAIYPL